MNAQTCPVCGGRGTMPESFYTGARDGTAITTVPCRSCQGSGYVLVTIQVVPYPQPQPQPTVTVTADQEDMGSAFAREFGRTIRDTIDTMPDGIVYGG